MSRKRNFGISARGSRRFRLDMLPVALEEERQHIEAGILVRIAEIRAKAGPECRVPSLDEVIMYGDGDLRRCDAIYPERKWYEDCPYCGRYANKD